MKLIGISGKIGTGKTTVTNYMLEKLPGKWKRLAFGDALKEEVSQRYGVPLPWAYDHKDYLFRVSINHNPPKEQMTVREVLQWHGTEIRRKQDPEYWVNRMADIILKSTGLDGIIVDDVRFPDEANLVRELNGLLVRLNPYSMWMCDASIAKHTSETALDNYLHFDLSLSPAHGKLEKTVEFLVNKINA